MTRTAKKTTKSTVGKKTPVAKARVIDYEFEMTYDRDTKGTFVYKAEGEVPVTSLYVQRSHMPDGAPQSINVRINTSAL